MDNPTPNSDLSSQNSQTGHAQAASPEQTRDNGSTYETRQPQPRPPQPLPGYQQITLTHGSPFRSNQTECPICLLEITPIQETLTHSNGTCNRSFHQDCWEPWIADMGTCANCRERLHGSAWGIAIQAINPNFHAENGNLSENYRASHNPQNLVGQEFLEYHVTWVLSRNRRRLRRQNSILHLPTPFSEIDVLRLWFSRRREEFNITGIATRWQHLVRYTWTHSEQTRLIVAQFEDIRGAFSQLVSVLPHVYDIYRLHGGLTRAVFNPHQSGRSTWEEEVVPRIRDETRDEVEVAIRRWTLAFDQAFHLEEWLDEEQESLPIWERLVNRLDRRINRQWRREM